MGLGHRIAETRRTPGRLPGRMESHKPELVRQVRKAIFSRKQGDSDNTFRANPISLAPHGLDGQVAAINRAGVRLSREAAGREALVFASIGPSGKMLVTKEVTPERAPCGIFRAGPRAGRGKSRRASDRNDD